MQCPANAMSFQDMTEFSCIRKFLDEIKDTNGDDFSASTKNYIVIDGG
jgi:hypothetical protein